MNTTLAERVSLALAGPPKRSQKALAAACGISPPSVNGWVTGSSKTIEGANLLKAASFLGVNAKWLAEGVGPMRDQLTPWVGVGDVREEPAKYLEADQLPFLPGFEALSIPVLAQSGSMGLGEDQLHDEVVVGRLTVSPQWVSRTIKPLTKLENLRFIHGYGDSMDPTFADGDILLVDAGIREPKIDGVYVLEANDRIYIKRVRQRMNGTFEISSDNPNVRTVDVLDGSQQVNVRGRVVWVWNGKKL